MLNDWKSALTGHTSKVLFGNKLKEEIYWSSKRKTKSKDYSKVLHQANDPFVRTPWPALVTRGVATGDLPLSSKVWTYPEARKLSLPPAKKLLVLQDLPQVHLLVRSLFPEDLQCWYWLAGRLKYFWKNWEKVSSDRAILHMISGYKVPFPEVPRQSKYPRQVPMSRENSLLVVTDIHSQKKRQSKW